MATTNKWKTDGGEALVTYCKRLGISLTKFCDINGLDRVAVQRAVKGERPKHISVDFALRINRATKGRVKVTAWASKEARASKGKAA